MTLCLPVLIRHAQAALRAFTGTPPSDAGAPEGAGGAGSGAALGSVPRVQALVADLEVCLAGLRYALPSMHT